MYLTPIEKKIIIIINTDNSKDIVTKLINSDLSFNI